MDTPLTTHTIEIHAVAHGGAGVGRAIGEGTETRTWLIDGALPGERVAARPVKTAKRWIRGGLEQVISASPNRVTPACSLASVCGGCAWQHVDAKAQIGLKRAIVDGALRHLGAKVNKAVASPAALGYRRRARLHYQRQGDGLILGFREERSHALVDVARCPVLDGPLNHAFARLRGLAAQLPAEGEVFGVSDGTVAVLGLPGVRPTEAMDELCRAVLLDEVLIGVALRGNRRRHSVGQTSIELDGGVGIVPMLAGPFSFSQAQAAQNRALVEHVAAAAQANGKRVLELYAGSGNFTRALARTAQRVWAVEGSRESVAYLRALSEDRKLPVNAKHSNIELLLPKLAKNQKTYDLVVLDPPRAGIGEEAAAALAKVASDRIVYVSCDPSTLARDLAVLTKAGHQIVDVTIFDMMPMTPEIETVVTLRSGGRR
ncbi:MAG: class I SAM-dependent RNA methyltransferase [Nannocystis sp.]|nr:class I SAM-dependent RNA methyltransferase [Nannocystis sp.]